METPNCRRLTLLFLAAFLVLMSCTDGETEGQKADVGQSEKPVTIEGDVFIVTRGGANIKLGLVNVSAVPESTAQEFIATMNQRVTTESAAIRSNLEQAEDGLAQAQSRFNNHDQAYKDLLAKHKESGSDFDSPAAVAERDVLWERRNEAMRALVPALALRDEWAAKARHIGSASFYFESLPTPVATAKTDAEGKFTMRVPGKGRYVLMAQARRDVLGETEEYYWMVWAEARRESQRIFLSNDNLLTANSPESVFQAHDL